MRSVFLAAAAAVTIGAMPVVAQEDSFYLDILSVEVKIGHVMAFRDGVKAYLECYEEAGGKDSWSTWSNMDGDGAVYLFVSRMENWAALDRREDARRECFPVVEEEIAPHMVRMNTTYAKHLPDWSADGLPEDMTVARVHYFSVDDQWKFRSAIGSIAGVRRAVAPEDMGMWYDVQGGGTADAEYFVVQGFKNFAAMDEDQRGPYGTMKEHAGEGTADLIWGQYQDSLEDGDSYWSSLLAYEKDLSRNGS